MNDKKQIPAPSEFAGGVNKFEKLTEVFYDKVLQDELLEPVFRKVEN